LIVTCQLDTAPASMPPRTSITSNQRRLCTVLPAREIAFLIASSTPTEEVPVISSSL